MEQWVDFDVVTRETLRATLSEFDVPEPADIDTVADAFVRLPLAEGDGMRCGRCMTPASGPGS